MSYTSILITGTARYSLGDYLLTKYCANKDHLPIITLDQKLNPRLDRYKNIKEIRINLNPFDHQGGYVSFSNELHTAIHNSIKQLSCDSISTVVLSAALYHSGPFAEQTLEVRKDILGVNICGKYEVLHSVLSLNQKSGFNNKAGFTLIDVGSTHGLRPSQGRSLYAPSKAFGLNYCIALQDEGNINRCIHLAPGPIDTHMLHRNYWVNKEKGPSSFFDNLWKHYEKWYYDIFVECSENSLTEACTALNENFETIKTIFDRYKNRRQSQLYNDEGILQPEEIAELLTRIINDNKGYLSGVYIITAPKGRMQVKVLLFSKFCHTINQV